VFKRTEKSTASVQSSSPLTSWLADDTDPNLVYDLLHEVIDPELGVNIVDLGLVYDVQIVDRSVRVTMTLTTPGCPLSAYIDDSIHRTLWGTPGVGDITVDLVWEPPWDPTMMSADAKQQLGWLR